MEQAKKHIFWIIFGVLLLAAVVASYFITGPVRAENENRVRNLEQRIGQLKKHLQTAKNEEWIKHAQEHQKMIEREEKDAQKFLLETDFTRLFPIDRNDPESKEQTDPALWKDLYKEELNLLSQSLRTAQVLIGPHTFHTRLEAWGDRVPSRPEMEIANKEFYILEDVSSSILKMKDERDRTRVFRVVQIGFPGVEGFGEVRVGEDKPTEEAQVKRKKVRDTYMPIPVIVVVDMDSKYLEKFLAAILSSPWRYTVQTCDVVRIAPEEAEEEGGGFVPPEERKKKKELPKERKDLFENTTVRVKLYLEALDFSVLKDAMKKKTQEGATE